MAVTAPGHYFPLDFSPWCWPSPPGLVWELQEFEGLERNAGAGSQPRAWSLGDLLAVLGQLAATLAPGAPSLDWTPALFFLGPWSCHMAPIPASLIHPHKPEVSGQPTRAWSILYCAGCFRPLFPCFVL